MSLEQIIGFTVFSFIAAATPGPNNVLLTAAGVSVGLRKGMITLWGIVFGFSVMIFVVSLSIGNILNYIIEYSKYIKFLGAILLIRLAWQIANAPTNMTRSSENESTKQFSFNFINTALFQWVNPKAWIVVTSLITTYMVSENSVLTQSIFFALIFLVTSTLGCAPWLLLGTALSRFLIHPVRAKVFNISMAVLLIISVIPNII